MALESKRAAFKDFAALSVAKKSLNNSGYGDFTVGALK
jgi:hypothetical protein